MFPYVIPPLCQHRIGGQAPLFVFLDIRVAGPLRIGSHGAARSTRRNTSMNCHAEPISLSTMATAKKCPARATTDIAVGFAYSPPNQAHVRVQISAYMRYTATTYMLFHPPTCFPTRCVTRPRFIIFSKKMKSLRIKSFFLCIFAITNDLLQY